MTLYVDKEKSKILRSKKLEKGDIVLVHTPENFCPYQVWSNDGELMYGTFRKDKPDDIALRIKMAYEKGFHVGKECGEINAKAEIRKVLGITE